MKKIREIAAELVDLGIVTGTAARILSFNSQIISVIEHRAPGLVQQLFLKMVEKLLVFVEQDPTYFWMLEDLNLVTVKELDLESKKASATWMLQNINKFNNEERMDYALSIFHNACCKGDEKYEKD